MVRNLHLIANRERAKALLVALVRECPQGAPILRTQLYKGYYFSLLMCMHALGAELVDWPVVKMPQGPGVESGEELLGELCAEGVLVMSNESVGPFRGFGYRIADVDAADRYADEFSEPETQAIRDACAYAHSKTAADLTNTTHELSRSWKACEMGHALPIFADLLLDDEPVEEMKSRLEKIADEFKGVF